MSAPASPTGTALVVRDAEAIAQARRAIAVGSKSFALASRVLPRGCRDEVAVLYAWCRRADDAVDEVPPADQPAALARLRRELDDVYAGTPPADDVVLRAFAAVVRARAIPRRYPEALLDGMAMDVTGTRYATIADLIGYCWNVASVVGLMMSHVMGVRDDAALRRAAHLGMAMQLTNVCRDVAEDWARGRLYVPDEVLARHGAAGLHARLGGPLPADAVPALAGAVRELLALADRYYASGDRGLSALPWRGALAVRAARRVYAAIGGRIAAQRHDVTAGRAITSTARKLWLLAGACVLALGELPGRAWRRLRGLPGPRVPTTTLELADVAGV